MLARYNTQAAPFAFIGVDSSLEPLGMGAGLHFDSLELAALDAVLAPFALVLIHHGQETIGRHQVVSLTPGYRKEILTAAVAAIAVSPVNEPGFLGLQCGSNATTMTSWIRTIS